MAKKTRLLARYVRNSLIIGVLLAVISLLIIWVGTGYDGRTGIFLIAIGGAIVPAAVASAIFDPLLREQAAEDIHALLGVRTAITRSGFRDWTRHTSSELQELVKNASEVVAAPLDIDSWSRDVYAPLVAAASSHPVKINLFFPSPDEPNPAAIATKYGRSEAEVKKSLQTAPDRLLSVWDNAPIHKDSSIAIHQYAATACYGITRIDKHVAVELGAMARDGVVPVPSEVILLELSPVVNSWVDQQLKFHTFSPGEVTQAGVRPLTSTNN